MVYRSFSVIQPSLSVSMYCERIMFSERDEGVVASRPFVQLSRDAVEQSRVDKRTLKASLKVWTCSAQ